MQGDTNEENDVFVQNLATQRAIRRISLLPYGTQATSQVSTQVKSSITTHGQYVAFTYMAPLLPSLDGELERVYLWDRAGRRLELTSANDEGEPATDGVGLDGISPHGVFVAFVGNAGNLTPSPKDPPQAFLRIRTS